MRVQMFTSSDSHLPQVLMKMLSWRTQMRRIRMLDRDSTVVQQMSETEENIDVANVDNNAIPNPLPDIINRNLVPYIRAQFND